MILVVIAVVAFLVCAFYYLKDKRLNYWTRKGVVQLDGTDLIYGDHSKRFRDGVSSFEVGQQRYREFKAKGVKFGGCYGLLSTPSLLVIDPELIKNVLSRDFKYFMDHGIPHNVKMDPLKGHLFNLEGAKWKNMRQKLTPTFSSGKIRTMFQIIDLCASNLKEALDIYADEKEPVEILEILARFSTDVIGNCAFGIECNSLKNLDDEFRYYGMKISGSRGFLTNLKLLLGATLPQAVVEFLKIKVSDPETENFFLKMVADNVEYREKNEVIRNDFFQLLLHLKNGDKLEDDANKSDSVSNGLKDHSLTIEEMAAQCYAFFVGGFDTSSNTMAFALYEMAVNQDVQDKLRNNINDVLKNHKGHISYDAIHEMKYLDKVINESMRKYPLASELSRMCNKNYKIPNTNVIIEKGTRVFLASVGIHRDEDYYPEPLKFDPERFSKENIKSRVPMTYLPFGEGPRQCIGTRFALLQSKMGVAKIIENFKITINEEKTHLPLKIKDTFVTSPDKIYLNLEKIQH